MKTINIVEGKFKVEIDRFNHTLKQYIPPTEITKGKNKGKMTKGDWELVGYYPNLKQCLNKCCELEVLTTGEDDLSLYEHIREAREQLGLIHGQFGVDI